MEMGEGHGCSFLRLLASEALPSHSAGLSWFELWGCLFLPHSLIPWQEDVSFPVSSGEKVRHGKAEDLREQQPRQPQQHRLLMVWAALLELQSCSRDPGTFCKAHGKSRNVNSH